ncbi:uncharacterized protein LOC133173510 [Saccostrea echinata]|uniref:uncharacterized protein LOC133173510 n=1 Tax=Saccostrea echinata TaxID=191078 RepID=UPI002A8017A2|nr:uncharacterized protein LOC133173510 [Saccostrea echinata]
MSLSKYATPEAANTARLAMVLLGPCADTLRAILRKEVSPSDLSNKVQDFRNDAVRNRQKIKNLNSDQEKIVFPLPTRIYKGDYTDLDISLLYYLLRNLCKTISPPSKGWGNIPDPNDRSVAANIERMRMLRNECYGHTTDLSLSQAEFELNWQIIWDIVVELEQHLGTTVYQDAVTKIKTCSIDPEETKKCIDLLGNLGDFQKSLNHYSETTTMKINKHCQDMSDLYVELSAFKRAKDLIKANGYVVLKGNPGSGKTTTAEHLMKHFMDTGKSPLQLFKVADIYGHVAPSENKVIFIDNLFGEFSMCKNDVNEFKLHSGNIKVLIENRSDTGYDKKSNILILTIRSDIYMEYVHRTKNDVFLQSSLIDLSSGDYALQDDEIRLFAEKYNLTQYLKGGKTFHRPSEMCSSIGFPQCCRYARDNSKFEEYIENTSDFFLNPLLHLRDYMERLIQERSAKTAVLLYILLHGGNVEFKLIDNFYKDKEKKEASLDLLGLTNSNMNEFQDNVNCFDNFLTIRDTIENTCKFFHSSVQDSIFNVFIKYRPKEIIEHCDHPLLLMLTTSEIPNTSQVTIDNDLFEVVAIRIAKIVSEKSVSGYISVSLLELWSDSKFHDFISKTQECTSNFRNCRDLNGDSIMVHFAKAGNKSWVEYLLPNSDNTQRYRSLNAACLKNQTFIVDFILSQGVECDLKTCFNAVQSGNLNLLMQICESVNLNNTSASLHPIWSCMRHSLLQEICYMRQTHIIEQVLEKYPSLAKIKSDQGANALHSVASAGDKAMFELLLQHGLDPYEKDTQNGHTVLTCACQEGKLEMVKYLIEKYPMLVQYHTDKHGKTLLHWAAFSGQIDMFEYILDLFEKEKVVPMTDSQRPIANSKNIFGETILHTACSSGRENLTKYLMNRYPHLLKVRDLSRENVLHKAARGGSLSLFQFLLHVDKDLEIDEKTYFGRTVLHICCLEGRTDICKYLVNNYSQILHVTDCYGWTVLHAACLGGNVDIIDFLVTKGMDMHALTKKKETVLYIACRYGQYAVCEYIIHNYPQSLDIMDETVSVLHCAAWKGYIDIVKLLIEKGWNVRSVTRTGDTVLHLCCRNSQLEMCQYLINNHSDLLPDRDVKGWTALHSACMGGNEEILSFLITQGMDINELTKDSKNALHIACRYGNYAMCKYLVQNYENLLHGTDKYGYSVLHSAVLGGDVDIVKMLIDNGANFRSLTNKGETVLHVCALDGKIQVCRYLIENFPDLLKAKDQNGFTVLHSVCKGGNLEMISLLITKGLNILESTNNGQNVLEIACLRGKYDACKYLLEHHQQLLNVTDRKSLLHSTVVAGNVNIVELLVKKGIGIGSLNSSEETVLHVCCRKGKIKMIKYLVNNYSNLLALKDPHGWTALHTACKHGNLKVVSFLISKGTNINSLTKSGQTVLHIACLNGKFDVCKYLIDNHPQLLNVKDECGNTVLHDAAFGGKDKFVKLFIDKGMNVKTPRNNGETVLHLCCRGGKLDTCKYLLSKYSFLQEITDNEGCTVLHSACKSENVEMIPYLIAKGLDIKALTKNGANVLHIACLHSNYGIFEYLFNNYLQLLDVGDKCGRSVLDNAIIGGNIDIVKKLIDKELCVRSVRKNDETLLHFCCREGKLKMCKFLVNKCGHLLRLRDQQGKTVLHSACEAGSVETCSFLIEKGMDINAVTNEHQSVLHVACLNGQYDLCDFLIKHYPHLLNFLDKRSRSVLHDAAMGGNIDIVKLLTGKWVDVSHAGKGGETISHFCCSHEHMKTCEYLVNCNSDLLHLRDSKGWTVLHSACKGGNVEIISYLVAYDMDINDLTNDRKSVLHIACLHQMYDACELLLTHYPHLLDVKDCDGNTALDSSSKAGDIDMVYFLSRKKNVNNLA